MPLAETSPKINRERSWRCLASVGPPWCWGPAAATAQSTTDRPVRSLDTRLTREYGVRFPFVGAGIREVKAQTDRLFGVDFIFDDSAFGPIVTDEHIDVCLVERVQLAVFH